MNRLNKIISHMEVTVDNHAITPDAPKTCRECKIEKPVTEFRKYSKGSSRDPLCLPCRRIIEKKKRDERKLNPVPPKYPIEKTPRRGRPKKEKEVKEEEVKEEETHRICSKCNENKELTVEYYHRRRGGFFADCKICRNKRRRELYMTNEEFRKKKAEYQKKYAPLYAAKNKEKMKVYRKRYMDKTKEQRNIKNKLKRKIKKEEEMLKKQEEYQKLIREEALKLLKDRGIEILN